MKDSNHPHWWRLLASTYIIAGCNNQTPSFETKLAQAEQMISSLDAIVEDPPDEVFPPPTQTSHSANDPQIIIAGRDPIPAPYDDESTRPALELATHQSEFTSSAMLAADMVMNPEDVLDETRLTMSSLYVDDVVHFQQAKRATLTDNFTQGSSGYIEDIFSQTSDIGGTLDIMVVIDNSGSMNEEQLNLANKLDPLLTYLQGADWRIAVNTTDPNQGCINALITSADSDPAQAFSDAVTAGINGSGNERGILQAVSGLRADCVNTGWIRESSSIAVLIVSDEDNCSAAGTHCPNLPYNSEQYLIDYLSSIREIRSEARVYGIISHPSAPCSTAYNTSQQYAAAIEQTGGAFGDICQSDYTNTLEQISGNMASILNGQFTLTQIPDSAEVQVFVNDIPAVTGWALVGNVLEFSVPPPADSIIKVSYQHNSTVRDRFSLSQSASGNQISVSVDGLSITNFEFDSVTNAIVFSPAPPDNALIIIQYQAAVGLNTSFLIGTDIISSTVRIEINGDLVDQSTYTFDAATGSINFVAPPQDGDSIIIEYHRITDPLLEYPWDHPQAPITAHDLDSGDLVPFGFVGQKVVFELADHSFGRRIALLSQGQQISQGYIDLAQQPSSEVQISFDNGSCSTSETLELREQRLYLNLCDLSAVTGQISISYFFTGPIVTMFEIDDPTITSLLNEANSTQIWTVKVNGQLFSEFEVIGNTVVISEGLLHSAAIIVNIQILANP
jgi:hypothetical protein